MDDRVEHTPLGLVVEDDVAQPSAVELATRGEDLVAEVLVQLREGVRVGRDGVAGEEVEIDKGEGEGGRGELAGDGRFA